MATVDLTTLAAPAVIEVLDFESLLAQRKARLLSLVPAEMQSAVAAVIDLESEPLTIDLQESAYHELIMRARINDAASSNLIALATGSNLDHLVAWPAGITRLEGETDQRLRDRAYLELASIGGNGTREQYIAKALGASTAVLSAEVFQPGNGGVGVAIIIAPSANAAQVQALVETALLSVTQKVLGVSVQIVVGEPKPINISATLYRTESAPANLVDTVAAGIPAAIDAYRALGRPVPLSWITAKLQADGIHKVLLNQPMADVAIDRYQYAAAGTISLVDGGVVTW